MILSLFFLLAAACEPLVDFPPEMVAKVLKDYQVPASSWNEINRQLTARVADLPAIMKKKREALKIKSELTEARVYRDALLEIFIAVLKEQGIPSERTIKTMFDDLLDAKATYYWNCARSQDK